MSEEEKIKKFDSEQLEILLNDLQDIDKFTGFKDGAFKYELGKYQANLLINCINKYKKVIDKAIECISELDDNTDDITCYDIDKDIRGYILSILKEVE